MTFIIDNTKDTFGKEDLLLYWIYWLRELVPKIETDSDHKFHKSYIKLIDYYLLNFDIIKNNPDKNWLFKSRLAISEKYYGQDFKEYLHKTTTADFNEYSDKTSIGDILKDYVEKIMSLANVLHQGMHF